MSAIKISDLLKENEVIEWTNQSRYSLFINRKRSTIIFWLVVIITLGCTVLLSYPAAFVLYLIAVGPSSLIFTTIFIVSMNKFIKKDLNTKYYITNMRVIVNEDGNISSNNANEISHVNIITRKNFVTVIFGEVKADLFGRYSSLSFYNLEKDKENLDKLKEVIDDQLKVKVVF